MIHNESINVWSHLGGALVFFVLIFHTALFLSPHMMDNFKDTMTDVSEKIDSSSLDWLEFGTMIDQTTQQFTEVHRWPLFIHLISAVICLSCSAMFHLFLSHSAHMFSFFARMDYAGISVLIMGSCIPLNYYSFYCLPTVKTIYLSMTVIMCSTTFIVTLIPKLDTPRFRELRTILFVSAGLCCSIPILHLSFFNDGEYLIPFSPFCWGLGGLLYVIGAAVYILRIPERFFPGKCDIFGHSHQIWHFLILAAATVHYIGSLQIYHARRLHVCPL